MLHCVGQTFDANQRAADTRFRSTNLQLFLPPRSFRDCGAPEFCRPESELVYIKAGRAAECNK